MKSFDQDRFGFAQTHLLAAKKTAQQAAKRQKQLWYSYVPTRKEVATLKFEQLAPMLTGWMCNSVMELIPSRMQIAQVIEILLKRPDATIFSPLLRMCENYVHGA